MLQLFCILVILISFLFMRLKAISILIHATIFLMVSGCDTQQKKGEPTSEDIITAKTLGLAYLEENQLEDAEAQFKKLVEYQPDEVMGYANLGIVYLRMGNLQEAEEWLQKAIKIKPKDPDVHLILAKIYELGGNAEKAVEELERIIRFYPGHVKTLYNLIQLYASRSDQSSLQKRLQYTEELVKQAPANLVPRLSLIEILILEGEADHALEQMEQLSKIFPEFPKEADEYFDQTMHALRSGDAERASTPFMIFHNYLKVTTPYQAGMMDLKGPGGSLVGSPIVTFDKQNRSFQATDWEEALAAIKFKDITASAGLEFLMAGQKDRLPGGLTHLAAIDYDGDGDTDLYAGQYDPDSRSYRHYLLENDWGVFQDVSEEAGINHSGNGLTAGFADFDNDGYLDLFVVRDGSNLLYRNLGDGTFENISAMAGVGSGSDGTGILFFDYDHDGDLDIYITRHGGNLIFRNNSDGTFTDYSEKSSLAGKAAASEDAAFGDFDEDGDIDLLVVHRDASANLYSNQRQGVFRDMSEESGLTGLVESSAVTIGDYNNDGFLDLFFVSLIPGECQLYLNNGDGSFKEDHSSVELEEKLQRIKANDAVFLDFDNDGYLDLLVVGEPAIEGENGVCLFHSDGLGKLWPTSEILPEDLTSGRKIIIFDYNADGDLDLAIVGLDGGIRLFRNDGGNNNHYIKMKLVGLRAGSAKNNYYGIGAKVEVRSGSLYQSKVVTKPDIHFGLGPRQSAEVIRIVWPNGVPQNMFFPATDQDLVEEQILKGSCPFLYTWDGNGYIFAKDIMWKSALGMPLGIMGERTSYASAEASVDYIKIPGELLKAKDKRYSLRVTCELWETIYMDKIELIVLDHPDSIDVFVDERMGPPNTSGYRLYKVSRRQFPVLATDHNGIDLLPVITKKDNRYAASFDIGRYQGITGMSDFIMDLGMINPTESLYLLLNGWIFPTDASINASITQSDQITITPPLIQAINEQGSWETIIQNLSFPMGKDKNIVADLSGLINVSDPRIRIRTNMQIYWDQVFFWQQEPDAKVESTRIDLVFADLHYRGFSHTYRKGSRYGPHWFDYDSVMIGPRWRDLTGNYTRYGDVLPLLNKTDDKYVIMNAGDEISIEFKADHLSDLPVGWKRDFLIHSVGWVKDGDLNTATGKTVEPLPFHGMTAYPYPEDEFYPSDPEHREYLMKYNTRKVSGKDFTKTFLKAPDL